MADWRCDKCRYHRPSTTPDYVECHGHTPVPVVGCYPVSSALPALVIVWPIVAGDDWCGSFGSIEEPRHG